MRRFIAIALAGASLGGCSSMSWDMFKSAPPTVQVRLESNPPGADATTSLGAGCKTPCSVSVPAPDAPFTVAFALPKYQPASVPVNVIKNPGDFTTPASVTTDPNPVFAELQPAAPPKPVRKPHRPKKPKPAATAAAPAEAAPAAAAAAPAAGSPFPDPNAGTR
ncbi:MULTISPECIES: hypothetical protein [Bradyrhizobium]|uniref:hypothetical protein n=1 Tax=Bradyrhizobium TaxID=374 RepID=UPI00031E3138|nr:hypothetical protein [Bradyrhizobium japonicum]AJA64031.1 hypothetical protein RN69_29680 [Bradyrhizobium japonicum]KMJ95915.1 hypothetical protein CF64_27965 [Bradyrhizobium japonicum]MBR0759967.1 hypothetical protein [Bradyrhizobium japonicum]MBR0912784.1 hypothetical protein [Bradyrhizobium japonicum]MCP1767101.1 hypothetical protein [Bradyrhizobium japonicum]